MKKPLLFAIACAFALMGCKKQEAEEVGHGHERGKGTAAPERPGLSITTYQDGVELFMEYPAFAVGEESPLVAHFTDARSQQGFKPITRGRVVATLRSSDGAEQTFVADKPLRDGIFKPIVTPAHAGIGTLTLRLESDQHTATVNVGEVVIHPNMQDAMASGEEEAGAEQTVGFLKESQWKTQYATAPAELRVLQGGVGATAELKPVAGQSAELSAPVDGRIPPGDAVPHLGQPVKKGDLLVRLMPTATASGTDLATVDVEAANAKSQLGLAEREYQRAQELFAQKAIPEKQLDAARVAREVAMAGAQATAQRLESFRSTRSGGQGGAQAAFELRSPIDGVVSFANVTPGAVVSAGERLVAVVNSEKLWLEARVYEADAPKIEQSPGASFKVPGFDREFTVDSSNGRRVAVGAVVDRASRTVPIIFELKNPEGRLKPGMFAKAVLFSGETVRGLSIPESAVVDDGGKHTVFVMDGGESFFKRAVKLGIRSGGYVQVLEGVKEGERVVSLGAYEIRLATASGAIPEHGHQH